MKACRTSRVLPAQVYAWLVRHRCERVQWIDREYARDSQAPRSILVWNPRAVLVPPADPFSNLRTLAPEPHAYSGWYGAFSYEWGAGRELQNNPEGAPFWLGYYDNALVYNHNRQKWTAFGPGPFPETSFWSRPADPTDNCLEAGGIQDPRCLESFEDYRDKIQAIREGIRQGQVYQVNYTLPFEGVSAQSPLELYCSLRRKSRAPYMALLDVGGHLLSFSPEVLLQSRDRDILSCPIKGTAPRRREPAADAAMRQWLHTSTKNRAELLMIVDLVRNDLGQVCEYGSVRVPRLFKVESFPTVHHLIAQVQGRLQKGKTATDAFRALFPGGSISGTPKRAALEWIHSLERTRRGYYTGSAGYFLDCGQSEWNILIRTLYKQADQVRFSAGGGIVIDSDAESEFAEAHAKVGFVLERSPAALES